jgi:hypothetical protein
MNSMTHAEDLMEDWFVKAIYPVKMEKSYHIVIKTKKQQENDLYHYLYETKKKLVKEE